MHWQSHKPISGSRRANFVCILWDETTILKEFDAKLIKECDKNNLDYKRMILTIDEIEVI